MTRPEQSESIDDMLDHDEGAATDEGAIDEGMNDGGMTAEERAAEEWGEGADEADVESSADAEDEESIAPATAEDSEDEENAVLPPMDAETLKRAIEAMLFATTEPMSTAAIRARLPEGSDIGGTLLALREEYVTRGVNLMEKDGTWAFRTAHDMADVLRVKREVQRKLSRSAMETLSIVAYHQPVTRAEIENIRGVATNKGTLDILMEIGWVRPGRRRETPGRPVTWVTTAAFMDHFGLSSLMDLPGLDELKASGLLDRRPAIETIGGTGDLFGDNDSEDLQQAAADLAAEAGDEDEDEIHLMPAASAGEDDDDAYDETIAALSEDDEDDEDADDEAGAEMTAAAHEAAYEDDIDDAEWEAAQADETPIAIADEEEEA